MAAKAKVLTQTVDTKFGQLRVVVDRNTGELVPEKFELHRVAKAPGGADPEVAEVAARIIESGLSPEQIEKRCLEIGRPVSRYTVIGMMAKQTKRPQNFTLTTIMMALGFDKTWSRKTPVTAANKGQSA